MESASPHPCRKLEGADLSQETQLLPALFYHMCLICIKATVLWAPGQLLFTIETKMHRPSTVCTGYKHRDLHEMLPL